MNVSFDIGQIIINSMFEKHSAKIETLQLLENDSMRTLSNLEFLKPVP